MIHESFDPAVSPAEANEYRLNGWWRDTTVLDDLARGAKDHPEKIAIIGARGVARDVVTVTYAELAAHVDRFARALLRLEVKSGELVAIQMPNWWQFAALALACARIGAIVAPIPPDYRRREVQFILERTLAPVYIAPATWLGFSHQRMIAECAPRLTHLKKRVLLDAREIGEGEVDFASQFEAGDAEDEELGVPAPRADDLFEVLYTSGTTGEPKGVLHTFNTNYAMAEALRTTMGLSASDVMALPGLITAASGFAYLFLMPLQMGATALYVDVSEPSAFLDLVERYGVTFLYALPTYVLSLVEAQRAHPRRTGALGGIATGSTPVPAHLIAAVRDAFDVRIYALWGMTENGAVTITRRDDDVDWPTRSDGRPVEWMQVKIVPVREEEGEAIDGDAGRLFVRGASQCRGYLKRPDLYASSLDAEGWFDTGDLARHDGRGGIRLVGRMKDLIIRHGLKVPVAEVESALHAHGSVREIAVVGVADAHIDGERVCAVVVPEGTPPTLDELRTHLRALGMSSQYWPDRLEVRSTLPKTPLGKIQKHVLRSDLAKSLGAPS